MSLENRLKLALGSSPGLGQDPDTALALASSSLDDGQMVRAGQTMVGLQAIGASVSELSKKKPNDQWANWSKMDTATQRLYVAAGYQPPADPGDTRGLIGKGLGAVGSGLGFVFGNPFAPILRTLDAASEEATQAYRASRVVLTNQRPDSFGEAFRIWQQVNNGERYFLEKDLAEVEGAVGAENFGFVRAMAERRSIEDYLREDKGLLDMDPIFQQEQIRLYGMLHDETIAKQITRLSLATISPGRDMARLFLNPDTDPGSAYNRISGGIDGAYRWFADPTLLAGQVGKGVKMARYALKATDFLAEIQRMRNAPKAVMAAERIAVHFKAGTMDQLVREMPGIQHGLLDMQRWAAGRKAGMVADEVLGGAAPGTARGIETADDVFDYYESVAGRIAIVQGKLGRTFGPNVLSVPLASRLTETKGMVKSGFETIVDKGRFLGTTTEHGKLVRAAIWIPRSLADGTHGLFNMVPKSTVLNPQADDAPELFRQVLNFHLPKTMRDQYFNDFILGAPNHHARMQIYEEVIDSLFTHTGARTFPEGSNFVDRFKHRMHQRFAAGGIDIMIHRGGRELRDGILISDLANAREIPGFRDMLTASLQASALRHGGQRLADYVMTRFWKPAVLLRVGFIPRAFGEELLWAVSRVGPKAVTKAHLTALGLEEGQLALFRPLTWTANAIAENAPKSMARPASALQVGTEWFTNTVSYHTRAAARKLAKTEYEYAVNQALQHNPTFLRDFMEQVSAQDAFFPVTHEDGIARFTVQRQQGDEIVDIELRTGSGFEEIDLTQDPWAIQRLMIQYQRAADDPVMKMMVDAAARWLSPAEQAEIVARARQAGFEVNSVYELRQLVPQDVSANFEKFLYQGIGDDTIELPQGLYEFIDEMDVDTAVAIFSRHGALDDHFRQSRMGIPDAQGPRAEARAAVTQAEDSAYERLLQALWEGDEFTVKAQLAKIGASRLGRGDLEHELQRAVRAHQTRDGREVSKPVPEGHKRVYTLSIPEHVQGAYAQMLDLDPEMLAGEMPFLAVTGNTVNQARGLQVQSNLNGLAWFSGDAAQVKLVKDQLDSHLRELGREAGQTLSGQLVTVSYVDVPVEVFNAGRKAATSQMAGGLDAVADARQMSQIFVPAEWKARTESLGGEVVEINGELFNGIDRATALEDWGKVQVELFDQYFPEAFRDSERDLRPILRNLRASGKASQESFNAVRRGDLPTRIASPRLLLPYDKSWIQQVTDQGFEWIGRAGDAIIRKPLAMHFYAEAQKQARAALSDVLANKEALLQLEHLGMRYGGNMDQITALWSQLPEEVRFAANPKERARLWDDDDILRFDDGEGGVIVDFRQWDSRDLRILNRAYESNKYVDKIINDVAVQRAMNEMIPFIDDHRLRSQFQEKHRNLIPFHFAEEQFIKRWARTLRDDPALVQKMALTLQGLRHIGVIEKNEYGEDVYVLPGTAPLMNAVTRGLNLIGFKSVIPISAPFTGQLRYTTPGLDRFGMPSFGPLLGVPMSLSKRLFPELAEVEDLLYGERGARRTIPDQLMPTSFMRFYHALTDSPETSAQFQSAMITAMAYMESEGLAPADDASAEEVEEYMERVENWTRATLLMRAVVGFFSPASPQLEIPGNLKPEFTGLLKKMPLEDAIGVFMKANPDALPWTVFSTKSVSGAPLPATDKAYEIMTTHQDFINAYPEAGAWFLPQSDSDDPFSRKAYYQQLAQGLRVRKAPREWYRDMKFAKAAETYFKNREAKDIALGSGKYDSEQKRAIREGWAAWKDEYFRLHPVFAEELQDPEAHIRRQRTISQMFAALDDPRVPKVPQADDMRLLLRNYQKVQGALDSLAADRTRAGREAKDRIRDGFELWADGVIRNSPHVAAFYNRVIKPEMMN